MSATSPDYRADDGGAYERFLGRWTQRLALPFIEFARLPPLGDVLEVGCGTGSLTLALVEQRPQAHIFAVDVAEPYLTFARTRAGGERVRFEVGDACRLNFPSGRFSAVLAQLVLNFVPDAEAAVGEMRRVSRPEGVVAAAVWDFRGGLVYQRLFWDTASGVDPAAAAARDRLFSHPLALPDGLIDLWRRAGLTSIERASITIRMTYASFNDYWEPLLGGQGPVGTYVQGLTPGMREKIEERVRAAYLSGAGDGPRSMTATAWAVRGVAP
ncbi:MAG TPA: class I SAM-dependent methyltransferase [Alphaproteobacteria bacterium]|nr:class I SAM-dependent methyltransferase [Alphaproteobacteria bacterium]